MHTHVCVCMCLLLKNFTWSAKELCVLFLSEYKCSKDLTLDLKERRNGDVTASSHNSSQSAY